MKRNLETDFKKTIMPLIYGFSWLQEVILYSEIIILIQHVLILPAFLKINSSTVAMGITHRPAEESHDDHDNFDGKPLNPSASYHYNNTP